MARTVWHYTYEAANLDRIIKSGSLVPPALVPDALKAYQLEGLPRNKSFAADERMLLFSENDVWEPASYRGIRERATGKIIDVHELREYASYGMAVFRIGVDSARLHPYVRLTRLARVPNRMVNSLVSSARRLGSDPYRWWGTLNPVPIDDWLALEKWNGSEWADAGIPLPALMPQGGQKGD